MKKIIAMLLALVMLLSLAACASSGKTDAPAAADTAAPAETTDTTDTAPAADTKTDGKTYKVAIIKQGRLIASGTMDEVKGDQSLEAVFLELEGEKHA